MSCPNDYKPAPQRAPAAHSAPRLVPASQRARRARNSAHRHALTTPDLVLLSLLAEQPMHGYQANLELERREVRDWAGISRPQVYYSMEKLAGWGLLRGAETAAPPSGPERRVLATTESGRRALENALAAKGWTTARERPPFLTWLALSWQATPAVVRRQLRRRQRFLRAEFAREQATLRGILREVGHTAHEAVWMVSLVIAQFHTELLWLRKLVRQLPRRARARRPALVSASERMSAASAR